MGLADRDITDLLTGDCGGGNRLSYQVDDMLWFVLIIDLGLLSVAAYRVSADGRRRTAGAALLLAPVA